MPSRRLLLFFIALQLLSPLAKAQVQEPKGFKFPVLWLNKEKGTWVKFLFNNQFWVRYLETNPNTEQDGEPVNDYVDISVRRVRMGVNAQLTERLYFFSQFGQNNFGLANNNNPSINVLDLHADYTFHEAFALGLGQTAWRGLSRFTSPSSSTITGLDLTGLTNITVNRGDYIIRRNAIYAKGKIGHLDYRLVVAKPLAPTTSIGENEAGYIGGRQRMNYSGYFLWEFLEQERFKNPLHIGTYRGRRKIYSWGAGFEMQKNATASLEGTDTVRHSMILLATDLYMEIPLDTTTHRAIGCYIGAFYTDFGPNYLRTYGLNNPFRGAGNAYPAVGTGNSLMIQAFYTLDQGTLASEIGQWEVFGYFQLSDFEALNNPVTVYWAGFTHYFNGIHSKLTLGLQNRPYFENGDLSARRNELVLQYQVRID